MKSYFFIRAEQDSNGNETEHKARWQLDDENRHKTKKLNYYNEDNDDEKIQLNINFRQMQFPVV